MPPDYQFWPNDFAKNAGFAGSKLISDFRPDFNGMIESMLAHFHGGADPPVTHPGMDAENTVDGYRKRRNSADTAWNNLFALDVDFGGLLPKSGGTMTGAINAGGFPLSGLGASAAGSSGAARMSDLTPYAKLDGTTPFTGIPSGPDQDPGSANQLARKSYVDGKANAGGAYTGQILMSIAPSDPDHVTRQQDLDNAIQTHPHTGGLNGAKLESTGALKSTGAPAGKFLRADGAGAVAWKQPSGGSARAEPVVLFTHTDTTAWTEVDLTSEIAEFETGQQIRAVKLMLVFDTYHDNRRMMLELRRTSVADALPIDPWYQSSGASEDTYKLIQYVYVEVPLTTAKTFEYRATRMGGSASPVQSVTAHYLGYA